MSDLLPFLMVVVVGASLAALQASRFPRPDSTWILWSFAAHVMGSALQVWFTHAMYGSGDMTTYARVGELLAAVMRIDPVQFVPEVVALLFQQPALLPVDDIFGPGTSTGSMFALTGLLTLITGGGIYTTSCSVAIGAHFGQVALYKAFKSAFPGVPIKRLLFSAMLVPSTVFWSSGLIKEGLAIAGLGYVVLGVERFRRGSRINGALNAGLGSIPVALFKPYVLVALLAGTVGCFYFNSPKRRNLLSRPSNILGGALIGVVGAAALLRLFPSFRPEAIASQAAHLQEVGQLAEAKSNYTMGDPTRTSFAGQIAFAPFALLTSLFRPFLFEARSPQVFVNAVETTTITVMLLRLLWRRRMSELWAEISSRPMLVFGLVFIGVFGVGVGISTTNLGALSRYRAPLVPFLWGFVLVLSVPLAPAGPLPLRPVHPRARTRALGHQAELQARSAPR